MQNATKQLIRLRVISTVRLPVAECLNYGLRFMRTYFSTDKLLNKLLSTLTSVKALGTPQTNEGMWHATSYSLN